VGNAVGNGVTEGGGDGSRVNVGETVGEIPAAKVSCTFPSTVCINAVTVAALFCGSSEPQLVSCKANKIKQNSVRFTLKSSLLSDWIRSIVIGRCK
jgi:hypothetical protein